MATSKLAPVHPGEVLLQEFLEPMGLTQYRLAQDWPRTSASHLAGSTRSSTASGPSLQTLPCDSRAISERRRASGSTLQAQYDLDAEADRLDHEVPTRAS